MSDVRRQQEQWLMDAARPWMSAEAREARMDVPELDIPDSTERRLALKARYGESASYRDIAGALRLIGKRDEVHPDDAYALVYPSRECAEVFAESNRRNNDVPSLGIIEHDGAWIGVLDLRHQATGLITPPAVADDGGVAWREAQRAAS
jgi:hypothetical protein